MQDENGIEISDFTGTQIDPYTGLALPSDSFRMYDYMPEPVKWIWRNWLASEHLTLLASRGGTGKGSIALEMCLATIGALDKWPDGTPAPEMGEHCAMLLSYEDLPKIKIAARIAAFGVLSHEATKNLLIHSDLRVTPVKDAITTLLSLNTARGGPPVGLIVIDPLANVVSHDNVNENDNSQMTGLMQEFASIAEVEQLAILVVHHNRKVSAGDGGVMQDHARGASAIANSVRCYWELSDDPAEDDLVLFMGKTKNNLGPMRGVIKYEMEHWDDSRERLTDGPDLIETGVLRYSQHYDDKTLQQVLKDRKNTQKQTVAEKAAEKVQAYMELPATENPRLQSDLLTVFDEIDPRTLRAGIKVLEDAGVIGRHPLTKTEAKELQWPWRPKQYTITLLGKETAND